VRLAFLFTSVFAAWLLHAAAPARAEPPAAADEPLPITAGRLLPGERLRLDARLSHPAWQRAPVFDAFVEQQPDNGAAPPQRTRVRVLADERAIWVAIEALDGAPERIRDQVVRYDGVNRTQDFVVVYLDAIGSRRAAQWFRVNAAGSLADGMHTAADNSEDFAPDFDWDAAVFRHAGGWNALLRLPFASLRFAEHDNRWRIMVARRLPREQFHLLTSLHLPRGSASFIDRLQALDGVELPAAHGFLTLRPSFTARTAEGDGARARYIEPALDLKWRPRAELVVDATLNPDFSQVALDLPQLAGNTRFALFLREKRPFFFESSDLLRSPTEAFYTRSVTQPRWGARATWRGGALAGTALAAADRGGGLVLLPGAFGTGLAAQPASTLFAARAKADQGALQWGALVAARRYAHGRGENLVAGPDAVTPLGDGWRLRAQALASHTTAWTDADGALVAAPGRDGHLLHLRALRNTPTLETDLLLEDIADDFRHDLGFVRQAGVRRLSAFHGVGWRRVGPFNDFWLNARVEQVRARDGELVAQLLRPGLWATGAHNLDWWLELLLPSELRTRAGGPLLRERYVESGVVVTPARWFPMLEARLALGRLADTVADEVRDGARLNTTFRLRPLSRLELEPSWGWAMLRDGGAAAYRESAGQLLAVWHLDARQSLRAIVQRVALDRRGGAAAAGERWREDAATLTWAWRRSAGTQLFVGGGAVRSSPGPGSWRRELFVKLQLDLDEVLVRREE
jgi:hypothetical protein